MITATGGHAFTGATTGSGPATISGTLATVSDSDLSTSPSDYSVTIDWGDGSGPDSSADVEGTNGSFTVSDNHAYASPGHYTITVTVAFSANAANAASAVDSATIAAPPPAVTAVAPKVGGSTSAGLSGSVDPNGLGTVARFEYGLDPKYAGGGPVVYDHSTPTQTLPGDFAIHPVSATVTGLVPNALYHFRLVASNSAGTTTGPDQTFTTRKDPPPPAPVLGQSFNAGPVSGLVLIKLPPGAKSAPGPARVREGQELHPADRIPPAAVRDEDRRPPRHPQAHDRQLQDRQDPVRDVQRRAVQTRLPDPQGPQQRPRERRPDRERLPRRPQLRRLQTRQSQPSRHPHRDPSETVRQSPTNPARLR